jgi:hypothetical protein
LPLDLVLLAAGRGRRFGGFKQTAAVGPHDQALCEYTVFDALEAGFERVVLVTSAESAEEMAAWAAERFGRRVPVAIAIQPADGVPEGRGRPWGTGHAVLAAAAAVDSPFAVANADDHYGPWAFVILARFLRKKAAADAPGLPATWAMVGFPLLETLPHVGAVSRAVCAIGEDHYLTGLGEHTRVQRLGAGAAVLSPTGDLVPIVAESLTSMNAWAFTPAVFGILREGFAAFRRQDGHQQDEFRLPTAIAEAIAAGRATVRVLPGADEWFGLTHPDDVRFVHRRLEELTAAGRYPAKLWR